ncbi:hypothetical protein FAGKG844_360036 [Frankia sp. AgKG'84/4]|nr:acyl-CoA dehydrogenase family protein [Frankia sp. AgKG'84/4]MCL9793188.1 hypothetical protein [Frankia sp. AgKG'84/4]
MSAVAAEGILARTREHVAGRRAFGQPVGAFQHSRFLLAELYTEVDIARAFVDHCVELHSRGELSAAHQTRRRRPDQQTRRSLACPPSTDATASASCGMIAGQSSSWGRAWRNRRGHVHRPRRTAAAGSSST